MNLHPINFIGGENCGNKKLGNRLKVKITIYVSF